MSEPTAPPPAPDGDPAFAPPKAPALTPAEIDDLAKVRDRDVEDAARFWEAEAPGEYLGLMDATAEDGTAREG